MSKELSKRWKEMDDEAKKPFTEQAAADKTRYETEMASMPPPTRSGQKQKAEGGHPPHKKRHGRGSVIPRRSRRSSRRTRTCL